MDKINPFDGNFPIYLAKRELSTQNFLLWHYPNFQSNPTCMPRDIDVAWRLKILQSTIRIHKPGLLPAVVASFSSGVAHVLQSVELCWYVCSI
jgi:hypothetical protein